VRYSGFADTAAHAANGTHFVAIVDSWTLGLSRTGRGWRIASIGASE
jgi:hypothetical protein